MKRLLLSAGLMALASAAHAQLFTDGANFTVDLTNSPGTSSNTVAFSPGTAVLIDGGALRVDINVEDAGGGKEWVVFTYTTNTNAPLSQPGQNWAINQVGIPAAVPVNFIGDFTQFLNSGGIPFDQTVSIFGQTLMANPVPGFFGNGEGTLGFNAPFPAGPLPQLGAFANPFSVVTNALDDTQVFGFTQALEFEAQGVTPGVPEASTWAMMLLGFAGLGYAGFRRTSKLRLA